jgi:membrane dipeptidase
LRQKTSDCPSNINQAQELMRTSLVWDNHARMPLRPEDASFLPQLQDVRAAGVDVISLNAGFGPSGPDEHLAMLDCFTEWLNARADDHRIVLTVDDIQDARRDGKLAVLFDVEGMAPLNGGRLDLVEDFRRRRGGVDADRLQQAE